MDLDFRLALSSALCAYWPQMISGLSQLINCLLFVCIIGAQSLTPIRYYRPHELKSRAQRLPAGGADDRMEDQRSTEHIEKEFSELQSTWQHIQALLSRNRAQSGSFVNNQAQWDAMDAEDRHYISSLPNIETRIQELADRLEERKQRLDD